MTIHTNSQHCGKLKNTSFRVFITVNLFFFCWYNPILAITPEASCPAAFKITQSLDGLAREAHESYLRWKKAVDNSNEIKKLTDEIFTLQTEMQQVLDELRKGQFCNACGRSASQLRRQVTDETPETHFARNGGSHPASPEVLQQKQNEYLSQITPKKERLALLKKETVDIDLLHFKAVQAHQFYEFEIPRCRAVWIDSWKRMRPGKNIAELAYNVKHPPNGATIESQLAILQEIITEYQERWYTVLYGSAFLPSLNTKIRTYRAQMLSECKELNTGGCECRDLFVGNEKAYPPYIDGYSDEGIPGMPTAKSMLSQYPEIAAKIKDMNRSGAPIGGGVSSDILDMFH